MGNEPQKKFDLRKSPGYLSLRDETFPWTAAKRAAAKLRGGRGLISLTEFPNPIARDGDGVFVFNQDEL
jgi:hypothetical protein